MDAETKFNEADLNGDGVSNTLGTFRPLIPYCLRTDTLTWNSSFLISQQIDKEELDKVLSHHVTMFTPAMIQQLIKEIDQDSNDTLEFTEILAVISAGTSFRETGCSYTAQFVSIHYRFLKLIGTLFMLNNIECCDFICLLSVSLIFIDTPWDRIIRFTCIYRIVHKILYF